MASFFNHCPGSELSSPGCQSTTFPPIDKSSILSFRVGASISRGTHGSFTASELPLEEQLRSRRGGANSGMGSLAAIPPQRRQRRVHPWPALAHDLPAGEE